MRIDGISENDKDFAELRGHPKIPQLASIIDLIKGKVALIFYEESVPDFRKAISGKPIPREAKVGQTAPCDVTIPSGPTGLAPSEVNFFHALGLPVKINKSILDLQKDVHLLKKGQKVGNSEAVLLKKLNQKPFTYNLEVLHVYDDGKILPPAIFDMSKDEIVAKFQKAASYLAGLSIAVGRPNEISTPLLIQKSFTYLLALGLGSGYEFKELKEAKSGGGKPAPAKADAGKKEEKKDDKKGAKAPEPEVKEEEPVADLGGFFDFWEAQFNDYYNYYLLILI